MSEALEKEIQYLKAENKYFRDLADEAKKVIAQLHRGFALPHDVVYIHPADLAVLLQDSMSSMIIIWSCVTGDKDWIQIGDTRYKQSVLMPKHTTRIS